jgi:AraC family transcriptional regulator
LQAVLNSALPDKLEEVLTKIGWNVEMADDRPSLERLRGIALELFDAVSGALKDVRSKMVPSQTVSTANASHQYALPGTLSHLANDQKGHSSSARTTLADWQITSLISHIDSNIDSAIDTRQLAAVVRLSSFHFCRVFRHTFGTPPHRYIMHKRVERAQTLMLTTKASLVQIAADCGLADQSHFNKLFRRFVGETPGAWRRARSAATSANTSFCLRQANR